MVLLCGRLHSVVWRNHEYEVRAIQVEGKNIVSASRRLSVGVWDNSEAQDN